MDKEQLAIMRIQEASAMSFQRFNKPLLICDSGGKDSSVLKQIALNARIPFEILHNHTTADSPETFHFIEDEFQRFEDLGISCFREKPIYKKKRVSMWSLIPQKHMPPTRKVRYCCSVLKERGSSRRFIATGVRWAESYSRRTNRGIFEKASPDPNRRIILMNDNDKRRLLFENCRINSRFVVNPIIDWSDYDIWDYIEDQHIPCNPAYCKYGLKRCGCVGCPMAGTKGREREFSIWPKFRNMYIQAFDRLVEVRKQLKLTMGQWQSGVDVFHWWMQDDVLSGQMSLFDKEAEMMEEEYESD